MFDSDVPTGSSPGFSDRGTQNNFTFNQSNSTVITGRNVCRTDHLGLLPVSEGVFSLSLSLLLKDVIILVTQWAGRQTHPSWTIAWLFPPSNRVEAMSSCQRRHGKVSLWESLSVAFARRWNREALFPWSRMHSLCNNSTSAPLRGLRMAAPKHWNGTAPRCSADTAPNSPLPMEGVRTRPMQRRRVVVNDTR